MSRLPCPRESQEGLKLVAYLRLRGLSFTHIPNETGHDDYAKRRAIRMKQQGTSKGFPDYVIALPTIGILYIELKRLFGSSVSPEQKLWIATLNQCPNAEAHICKGADAAIAIVEELLSNSPSLPKKSPVIGVEQSNSVF